MSFLFFCFSVRTYVCFYNVILKLFSCVRDCICVSVFLWNLHSQVVRPHVPLLSSCVFTLPGDILQWHEELRTKIPTFYWLDELHTFCHLHFLDSGVWEDGLSAIQFSNRWPWTRRNACESTFAQNMRWIDHCHLPRPSREIYYALGEWATKMSCPLSQRISFIIIIVNYSLRYIIRWTGLCRSRWLVHRAHWGKSSPQPFLRVYFSENVRPLPLKLIDLP